MQKSVALFITATCLLTSACATRGGGPLGIVLLDPDQHVSGAEPLFGTDEDPCFDDPTFGLSFVSPNRPVDGFPLVCQKITGAVRASLPSAPTAGQGMITYSPAERNQIIDSFASSSNFKCGNHVKFLQQWDGNVNSTLGLSSQAAAGLAAIVTGGAAQAAAAAAAFLGGARGTMQNAYFHNKTVGVLASAFQGERKKIRDTITAGENEPVAKYTLAKGVEDVLNYHGNCSIASGLSATQRAVDAAQNPNLDMLKEFFTKIEQLRTEAAKFVDKADPATTNTNTVGQ